MAVWKITQQNIESVKKHMAELDSEFVWFQPMNRGGCLQVTTHAEYCKEINHRNTHVKCSSGWNTFVEKLGISSTAILLSKEWLDKILDGKKVSIIATVDNINDKVEYKLRRLI